MSEMTGTIKFNVERMIPATPDEVFDGWLNPKIPGNPWHIADKFLLDPKVDGFFYWSMKGTAHYGRFTIVERPARIEHTWVSPNTLGLESTVTVTFEPSGQDTRMTLVHAGLPDNERGRSHEKGWSYFMGTFLEQFKSQHRK